MIQDQSPYKKTPYFYEDKLFAFLLYSYSTFIILISKWCKLDDCSLKHKLLFQSESSLALDVKTLKPFNHLMKKGSFLSPGLPE